MTAVEDRVFSITRTADGRLECQVCGTHAVILSGSLDNLVAESRFIEKRLDETEKEALVRTLSEETVREHGILRFERYQPGDAPFLLAPFLALYNFLSTEDHAENYHAELALLLTAWQWFNLIKRLLIHMDDTMKVDKDRLAQQLPRAYQALRWLLLDTRMMRPIRLMVHQRMAVSDIDAISNARMREMLLLSMVLYGRNLEMQSIGLGEAFAPFQSVGDLTPDWKRITIYPTFCTNEGAQSEVRRLIVETLLPRYNLIDAMHLARLLKKNTPNRLYPRLATFTLLPFAASLFLMFSYGVYGQGFDSTSVLFFFIAALQFFTGMVLPLFFLVRFFDWRTLPNFALPRVIGGVSIGFLTIALQGESAIKVANALWSQGALLIVLLWVGVLGLGFGYLFLDARPFTGDDTEAYRRAGMALLAATGIAVLSGLLVCAVTTAAYSKEWVDTGLMMRFVLGPFGWVSLGQWLAFVPTALFTGLVTQFIFEELTLPASVWSTEE